MRPFDTAAALARLRRAVEGMLVGDRMLELPTAAVYLAEAEWRPAREQHPRRLEDSEAAIGVMKASPMKPPMIPANQ